MRKFRQKLKTADKPRTQNTHNTFKLIHTHTIHFKLIYTHTCINIGYILHLQDFSLADYRKEQKLRERTWEGKKPFFPESQNHGKRGQDLGGRGRWSSHTGFDHAWNFPVMKHIFFLC